ncbi:hypothetical protein GPEL0_01f2534 [Geoanaerobacter pelophilus]|uniref:Uncharacterized protein n=1 Tax=Geoanaerobacter pelophilus TaxID=60036 RepID=A0ABQ0MIP1_9BACT|nr:hypothetical protein GPEL0_01f2534 [Geoanaerobacter pelophilus]
MYRLRQVSRRFLDGEAFERFFHLQAAFLDVLRFLYFSVFGHGT